MQQRPLNKRTNCNELENLLQTTDEVVQYSEMTGNIGIISRIDSKNFMNNEKWKHMND